MTDPQPLTAEQLKTWKMDTLRWTGDDYLWVNRCSALLAHVAVLEERLNRIFAICESDPDLFDGLAEIHDIVRLDAGDCPQSSPKGDSPA